MRIWIAAIAATLVQPLVLLAFLAYDLIRSSDPIHGAGFMVLSVLAVAGAAVLLLGIPAFLLLRRFERANWTSLAIAGFALGALPIAALSRPDTLSGYSAGQNWHGHYVETYISGVPTQYAWFIYGENVLHFGIHGLAGALVFYAVWSRLQAWDRPAVPTS